MCNETRTLVRNENIVVAKSCKDNKKKFWKHVKSKTCSFSGVGDIRVTLDNGDNVTITDDTDKSNAFVEYFSKVFTDEPVDVFQALDCRNVNHVMAELTITTDIVLQKLVKLKADKSPGADMIHPGL